MIPAPAIFHRSGASAERRIIAFALLLTIIAAAQPLPPPTPVPHYFAVTAYRGAEQSAFSNEVCWTNSATFSWSPSPDEGVRYRLYVGSQSHHYTKSYDAGTVTTFSYPPTRIPLPSVITVGVDSNIVFSATNPPGAQFFRLYHCPKTGADVVTVSPDLQTWSRLTLLFTTNHQLWIRKSSP